ncbi:MAG: rod shape-determining protein RodA [Patescibacteria group bacterium]|jgi:rod shape determining protein RodA
MLKKIIIRLKNFDWILFIPVMLLVIYGLVEIFSVSLGQGDQSLNNFKKQLFFALAGLVLLFVFSFLDFNDLRGLAPYLYGLTAIALLAVLFFGATIRGTKGWFDIAGVRFQPVEIAKIAAILFFSYFYSRMNFGLKSFKNFFISFFFLLIFAGLIMAQPDFGSAMILILLWLAMLVFSGYSKKYLLTIFLIGGILAAGGWFFYLKPYQKERVMTFANPESKSLKEGYNVNQAMIAVGAGRFTGRGIGFGSQSQLRFLPESQNDFIFAVIAEELGLLGVALVLTFFSVFFYRGAILIKRLKDDSSIFFILGAVSLIFIEMFINIGMNIGLLPVVGISLPFVSYGGSALVSSLILVGIMESIIIRSRINY